MKRSHKIAVGIALSLGLATAALAHPGGWGPQGGGYGMMGGYGPGAMAGYGGGYGAQLMTPEERAAFAEKMHNAASPEERQKLAAEHRAELQKRAQEKGVTLGPRGGFGRAGFGPGAGPCWQQGTAQ